MKVVIVGTGGFAREVHEILELRNADKQDVEFIGFLDDNEDMHGKEVHGCEVLGGVVWLKGQNPEEVKVINGIGSPYVKKKIVERVKSYGDFKFYTLIDEKAVIGERITLGEGAIVCAGTIITTDIEIRDHVTLNLNATIGHDVVIEDYATFAPAANISGNVNIGEGVDFGTNAVIIQGKNVGEWSIVGAGSIVVKDIPANTTSVGNPSKVIKEREVGWQLD